MTRKWTSTGVHGQLDPPQEPRQELSACLAAAAFFGLFILGVLCAILWLVEVVG